MPAAERLDVGGVSVVGIDLDRSTRCAHYRGEHDVVAIRFPCCDTYYPCFRCHRSVANHDATRWPRAAFDAVAVLCGACGAGLTIDQYRSADHACPECGSGFNPGCRAHFDRYFDA